MTFFTPAAAAASMTVNVPSTRHSSASRGSSAHWVMRMAARWKTRSWPSVSSRTSALSLMSPSTILTTPDSSAPLRFSLRPRTKLSSTTTSEAPASTSWSTTDDPIVPAPPVTRARCPEMGCAVIYETLPSTW